MLCFHRYSMFIYFNSPMLLRDWLEENFNLLNLLIHSKHLLFLLLIMIHLSRLGKRPIAFIVQSTNSTAFLCATIRILPFSKGGPIYNNSTDQAHCRRNSSTNLNVSTTHFGQYATPRTTPTTAAPTQRTEMIAEKRRSHHIWATIITPHAV